MQQDKSHFITYLFLLLFVGSGLLGISAIITPDFAIDHISADGILSAKGLRGLQIFRISAVSLGTGSLLAALFGLKFRSKLTAYLKSIDFPLLTILLVLIGWGILAAFNLALIILGFKPGTASYFPISVFKPRFSLSGLPFSILFLVVFAYALQKTGGRGGQKSRLYSSGAWIWAVGLLLILLGNLTQGSLSAVFHEPFQWGDSQYYHDAVKITDLPTWLEDFNVNQSSSRLASHSRTHPPFAVLLHYFTFKLWGNNLLALGLSFTVISSFSIFLVWKIMRALGLSEQRSSQFALLFSVLPAINIYSAVSLDGVILTTSTLFLLGMIKVIQEKTILSGILLIVGGFLLTNALTFGGMFLIMVLGLMAIRKIITEADYRFLKILLLVSVTALLAWGLMGYIFDYDHLQAFLTASHNENPAGFRLFSDPLNYTMTRIEGITEIALFASIGVLAFMLQPKYLNLKLFSLDDSVNALFLASLLSLLLMFLAGTYKTGETARACLFIYPYLLLVFRNIDSTKMKWITLLAGAQTLAMQTLGWYLW
ncbi:MAG: hypothetical protein MAG431_01964 [Chloroflexi bacterium]|nr:hypothetical protein [Chloroflexota bacterium]